MYWQVIEMPADVLLSPRTGRVAFAPLNWTEIVILGSRYKSNGVHIWDVVSLDTNTGVFKKEVEGDEAFEKLWN